MLKLSTKVLPSPITPYSLRQELRATSRPFKSASTPTKGARNIEDRVNTVRMSQIWLLGTYNDWAMTGSTGKMTPVSIIIITEEA